MKNAIPVLSLSILIAIGAPAVHAQDGVPSCDTIRQLLAGGGSAQTAITAATSGGMGLADSTLYVMGCVGEEGQDDIAAAGISAAANLAEAQAVADAVLADAGQNAKVINAVNFALRDYIRDMPQPDVYEDKYTPTGGDGAVSPAA